MTWTLKNRVSALQFMRRIAMRVRLGHRWWMGCPLERGQPSIRLLATRSPRGRWGDPLRQPRTKRSPAKRFKALLFGEPGNGDSCEPVAPLLEQWRQIVHEIFVGELGKSVEHKINVTHQEKATSY